MNHPAKAIFVGDPGARHADAVRAKGLSVDILPADGASAEDLGGGDILVVSVAARHCPAVVSGLVRSACERGVPVLILGQEGDIDTGWSGGSLEMLDVIDAATSPENLATRIQLHIEGRRLRAELADRNDELAAANERLQGLIDMRDNVLAVASHDLKTPVTTLKLFSDLMRSGALVEMNDKLQRHIDIMDSSLEKMERLVNEVLDISRLYVGEPGLNIGEFNLNSLIEDTVAPLFPRAIHKVITLDMTLDRTVPSMAGDASRLGQLVTNLVDNALKYTDRGGSVAVSTRHDDGGFVEFQVRDTGCGIPKKEQSVIFERFGQGSSRPTGGESSTGLGLFICKQITELHNGRIWVESSPGLGSIFFVSLPVNQQGEGGIGDGP